MKTKHRITQYHHLFEVMENNLQKWQHIDQFRSNYDEFVYNLKKTKDLNSVVDKDLSGTEQEIESLKSKIKSEVMPLLNLLELFAIDHKNKKLLNKVEKIKGKQNGKSGINTSKSLATILHYVNDKLSNSDQQEDQGNALQSYGINREQVQKLVQNYDRLQEQKAYLKQAKKEKKEAEAEINIIIKHTDQLIKQRFNKFMSVFENSEPAFFHSYREAIQSKPAKDKQAEVS